MIGVLGRLSSPIRPGGTGEMIYSQEGTRRVAGARSEDGSADSQRRGSGGHALRERNCVRAPLGRPAWSELAVEAD